MRVSKIRQVATGTCGEFVKMTEHELKNLAEQLYWKLTNAGFITEVAVLNGSALKIGLHMCSFRIDVKKLGYNADFSDYAQKTCKAGYKRTAIPTWDQRVEFNNIVNAVLDTWNVSANIKSGNVVVRTAESGAVTFFDYDRFQNERAYYEIRSLKEIKAETVVRKRPHLRIVS